MGGFGPPQAVGLEQSDDLTRQAIAESETGFYRDSPDGRWRLEFSGPSEIAMGLSTWSRATVGQVGTASADTQLDPRGSIQALDCFYPWDRGGRTVAIPIVSRSYNGTVLSFWDVESSQERSRLPGDWLEGLVWSSASDLLLLLGIDDCVVVGLDRVERVRIALSRDQRGSLPVAGWTPNGAGCFILARAGGVPTALFHDSATGRLTNRQELDPVTLLPYDEAGFLSWASGRRMFDLAASNPPHFSVDEATVGWLMRSWVAYRWEPATGSVLLATYRPTFEEAIHPSASHSSPVSRQSASPMFRRGRSDEPPMPGCTISRAWVRFEILD